MNNFNLEALVLKSTNRKDYDKVYTVLAKEEGLVTLYARGVRRIKSKRSGSLDTLNHIKAKVSKHGEFLSIDEVTVLNSFAPIKNSLLFQSHAFYLLELAYRLLKEEPLSGVFNQLILCLTKLSQSKSDLQSYLIVNTFEVYLMGALGYEINLAECVNCAQPFSVDWASFSFSISNGGLLCPKCSTTLQGVRIDQKTAEVLYSIGSNFKYKPTQLTKEHIYTADDLLKHYVKSILEDSFKSARVFKRIREVL